MENYQDKINDISCDATLDICSNERYHISFNAICSCEKDIEFFGIYFYDYCGELVCISLYEPVYIKYPESFKISDKIKEYINYEMNNGLYEKIWDTMDSMCNRCDGKDCNHYVNRKRSSVIPDYTKLH